MTIPASPLTVIALFPVIGIVEQSTRLNNPKQLEARLFDAMVAKVGSYPAIPYSGPWCGHLHYLTALLFYSRGCIDESLEMRRDNTRQGVTYLASHWLPQLTPTFLAQALVRPDQAHDTHFTIAEGLYSIACRVDHELANLMAAQLTLQWPAWISRQRDTWYRQDRNPFALDKNSVYWHWQIGAETLRIALNNELTVIDRIGKQQAMDLIELTVRSGNMNSGLPRVGVQRVKAAKVQLTDHMVSQNQTLGDWLLDQQGKSFEGKPAQQWRAHILAANLTPRMHQANLMCPTL